MSIPKAKLGKIRGVLSAIRELPGRISGRLQKKIAGFDQKISGFRQRRWL